MRNLEMLFFLDLQGDVESLVKYLDTLQEDGHVPETPQKN